MDRVHLLSGDSPARSAGSPWPDLRFRAVGSYSVLKVGRVTLAWKYRIPTIATFLFEQGDYYERPRGDPMAPHYDHMGTTGYRSTASAVRERLVEYGFTLPFWGGVCDELLDEVDELQVERWRWRWPSARVQARFPPRS
jgi:hypothetical protein